MSIQLPFVVKPKTKMRTVGNETVGVLEIRSVGALSAPEAEYFEKHRIDADRHLLKMTREAMQRTNREYSWDDVRLSIGSYALSSELKVEKLEPAAAEFDTWYSENTAKNNAIAAVAIMRNRVDGCSDMEMSDFDNEAVINPGLRAALIDFAIKESNGWPDEKADKPNAANTAQNSTETALTEAEAAK